MKMMWKWLIRIVLAVVVGVAGFVAVMWAGEWRPAAVEEQLGEGFWTPGGPDTLRVGDTITVLSWNIGYAGLGDDMDFFMDGGSRVRTSRGRTQENLSAIVTFLQAHASRPELNHELNHGLNPDFILLQEVDFDSKRSYGLNQYDTLRRALPEYMGWWGLNYRSAFVPAPLLRPFMQPMGRVKSGVALLTRLRPSGVSRLQYPGRSPFPVRLFNLKRCLLTAAFPVADSAGKAAGVLYLNNTHNSAFFDDHGDMRRQELDFLRRYLDGKRYSITMGDWNSPPPGYAPPAAAGQDEHFRPHPIHRADFPLELSFVYDPTTPSVRYGYEPYRPGVTTTTVIDFALSGPRIEPVSLETIDLGFRHSDHNPILARFVIR